MIDLHRTIASLHQRRVGLALGTTDLCFLVALDHRREREGLPSFDEEQLIDVFLQVCEVTEPAAENPRKRATHAIQRLREQRLLSRVDGAGLVRPGEYTMTRLAGEIVSDLVAEETLTRESLTLLTKTLLSQLAEVKAKATIATTAETWRAQVVDPLRITVGDLVAGIERRQRGLDAQQEQVREQIGDLLKEDWFAAVDACERLLADTVATLRELNEVLLQDSTQLQTLLHDIEQLATDAGAAEAEAAAQRVTDHVDRVAAWGVARQKAWSDYYQFVQRYLRDVVRLDPDRAVSQRLRDLLGRWVDQPFGYVVADAPSIRLLRDFTAKVERPAVSRPLTDREPPLEDAEPAVAQDIDQRVLEAIDGGASTLAEVGAAVLRDIEPRSHFRVMGRITAAVARQATVAYPHERQWVTVNDELEAEGWSVRSRGHDR